MKRISKSIFFLIMLYLMYPSTVYASNEFIDIEECVNQNELISDNNMLLQDAAYSDGMSNTLTNLILHAVYSEDQPNGEIIPNSLPFSQASTALNHGGSWLSISTIEVGYVNYRNAYFNGTPMELSDVLSFDIDGDGKIDYSLCIWRYDYDFTTGIFNAISRSAEYPWNTVYISNFTIR